MTEPLGVIGAVAAVSQITGDVVKLTTKLRRCIRQVRSAPNDVEEFILETSSFTGLLNSFVKIASHSCQNLGSEKMAERDENIRRIRKHCACVRNKMEGLVDRFAELVYGNMTTIQNIIQRIRWILDKPDVMELRLSLQNAMVTVNLMSTLFAWEDETSRKQESTSINMLIEQLKNLLPMSRMVTKRIVAHKEKYRIKEEPEVHDASTEMLAASREIQRQIAHVVKPHAHSEPATGRSPASSRRRIRRNAVESNSQMEPSASPTGTAGSAINRKSDMPEQRTARASTVRSKRVDIEESNHRRQISKTSTSSIQDRALSDIYQPNIPPPCNEDCTHKLCPLSELEHCIHESCPCNSLDPKADTRSFRYKSVPVSNTESEVNNSKITPEKEEATSRSERVVKPPHPTFQSDVVISELSDSEIQSLVSEWSNTSLACSINHRDRHPWAPPHGSDPSTSKSSSAVPATDRPRSPDMEKKSSDDTTRLTKETPRRAASDSNERGVDVPQQKPQLKQEQRQQGSQSQEEQRLPYSIGERLMEQRHSVPPSTTSEDPDDSDGSFEGLPGPYVPMPPFGGPGGRRRPPRPRT